MIRREPRDPIRYSIYPTCSTVERARTAIYWFRRARYCARLILHERSLPTSTSASPSSCFLLRSVLRSSGPLGCIEHAWVLECDVEQIDGLLRRYGTICKKRQSGTVQPTGEKHGDVGFIPASYRTAKAVRADMTSDAESPTHAAPMLLIPVTRFRTLSSSTRKNAVEVASRSSGETRGASTCVSRFRPSSSASFECSASSRSSSGSVS